MRKILVVIVVALMSAGSVIPSTIMQVASAQTGVALLADPEGDVRVTRGRHTERVKEKEHRLLNVGDVVSVNGAGTVVIYQAYVPVTRLRSKQQYKVERRSPPPPERGLNTEEFTRFKVLYVSARRNRRNPSPATMGGPEDTSLTLLEPRNSVALSRQPLFTWNCVSGATKYEFSVYDKNDKVICTESVSETQLTLPGKCKPLDPGDYKWDVTARIGDRVSDNAALYDATSFTVVTDERTKEMTSALEHARAVGAGGGAEAISVYASVLMESKLYPQAESELRRALEWSPKDQTLWALLIETYAQMKRWRAREKAREMSDGSPTAEMIRLLAGRR